MSTLQDKVTAAMRILFYALVFITPFAMTNVNSELFEFNKMWLVFGFTTLIMFFWIIKMVAAKRFFVRRTPLDIPILLFLASQIIATLFSLDPHTSFWGYYSRFNGGLLSTIAYILLYYALVTNFFEDKALATRFGKRLLIASMISGVLVALWGIPSHFGYDPTCLVFRYELNTKCWTAAFDPTARIFSTLGQPNWLAAYLSIILVVGVGCFIKVSLPLKSISSRLANPKLLALGIGSLIVYTAILWTNSQSGFLGLWSGLLVFTALVKLAAYRKFGYNPGKFIQASSIRLLFAFIVTFLVVTLVVGNPFPGLQSITFGKLLSAPETTQAPTPPSAENAATAGPALEYNITGSGDIRLIVWKGALDVFRESPLFGSGVETFAYSYYQHRPAEHNLTSEWDYLYNKAHNEYLNYLATTGLFGLATYLFFIGVFLFIAVKFIYSIKTITNAIIPSSLVGAFVTILVSNFFGFSVVLANLYLFIIPAIFFLIVQNKGKMLSLPEKTKESYHFSALNPAQILLILAALGFAVYNLWFLHNTWKADVAYALGYNYNRINEIALANEPLEEAVKRRPGEDLYKNELSANLASLAYAYAQENNLDQASYYAGRAKEMSDEVLRDNPNNIVYLKTRTRTLYTLAQLQPELLQEAYATILHASKLAPTDAKVLYNKALIEEVMEENSLALETLNQTITLKPNYDEPRFRKAVVLIALAGENADPATAESQRAEAADELQYILTNLNPSHPQAIELLKTLE